jgi:capsule polysaccharide export protein KpsE/RkpR
MDFDSQKSGVVFHVIVIILVLIILYYVYTTNKYMRQMFAATTMRSIRHQSQQPQHMAGQM